MAGLGYNFNENFTSVISSTPKVVTISADNVGCIKIQFPLSVPVMINPVVVISISVPNSALANVNTGVPPRTTSSSDTTPERTGVP